MTWYDNQPTTGEQNWRGTAKWYAQRLGHFAVGLVETSAGLLAVSAGFFHANPLAIACGVAAIVAGVTEMAHGGLRGDPEYDKEHAASVGKVVGNLAIGAAEAVLAATSFASVAVGNVPAGIQSVLGLRLWPQNA